MGGVGLKVAATVGPVVVALLLAASAEMRSESHWSLACRVLTNSIVPVMTGRAEGCLLKPYDRVVGARGPSGRNQLAGGAGLGSLIEEAGRLGQPVELLTLRGGGESWVAVPVVPDSPLDAFGRLMASVALAGVLGGVSILVLVSSREAAAAPFAYFYSCVSVALTSAFCSSHSETLAAAGIVAVALMPSTLAHLALTFPTPREVMRASPQILYPIYALSALLAAIGVANFERSPGVWILVDRTSLALALGTWLLLGLACAIEAIESRSPLERARARILLLGTMSIPVVPLVAGAWLGSEIPGGSLSLATMTVGLLPLPVGYAVSHYKLFDLHIDLRELISYVLYILACSVTITIIVIGLSAGADVRLPFGDSGVLFATVFFGFLVGDPVRERLRGSISRWFSVREARLAGTVANFGNEIRGVLDEAGGADRLCKAVVAGLGCRGASVFLLDSGDWRLVGAAGEGVPLGGDVVKGAGHLLSREGATYLPEYLAGGGEGGELLQENGVELLLPLWSSEALMGCCFVANRKSGLPLDPREIRCVEQLGWHAAACIHNAGLARSLVAAERMATRGRIGAGLIHDLGKPIGVIQLLAESLGRDLGSCPSGLDAITIRDLALEVRSMLRSFLAETREVVGGRHCAIGDVVDRAVVRASRSHGMGRISARTDPSLPRLAGTGGQLLRVLENLLENALEASPKNEVVELTVRGEGARLCFRVDDRGVGMSRDLRERVFQPFFSTRLGKGGFGVGLSVVTDLVKEMNGSISIESEPGLGTSVEVRLPLGEAGS